MNNIITLTFEEMKPILNGIIGFNYNFEKFFNEVDIFKIGDLLGSKMIPESLLKWDMVELGEEGFTVYDLILNQLVDYDLTKEVFMIITIESYSGNKIFSVPYIELEFFCENYSSFSGEDVDFFEPVDYIIIGSKNKFIYYVNSNGKYIKLSL